MKFSFFTVPLCCSHQAETELNTFLGSHRIVHIEKKCIDAGANSYWTFCVEWLDSDAPPVEQAKLKSKVDYREILDATDFAIYVKLRDLRKKIAKGAGVPPYVVFTNEQLADIVRGCIKTRADLLQLKGVGASRVEKYGEPFLTMMREFCLNVTNDETNSV